MTGIETTRHPADPRRRRTARTASRRASLAALPAVLSLLLVAGQARADSGPPPTPAAPETPDFRALVQKHEARTVEDRRRLHRNPELSLREFETSAYLKGALREIPGVELVPGDWGTGIVAMLRGGRPGPLVAWRADMDALPVTEETGLPFASTKRDTLTGGRETGVMHACGHDLHMSIALGTIRVLSEARAEMPGSLLFVFQPAEEIGAGAEAMLAAGLFDDGRKPKCILALHDHPTFRTGQIGSCPGWSTANVDEFQVAVKGRGGHGAYPHKTIDPVTLAARMVLAFNDIVAREIDVNRQCVISVGSIQGGSKSNVIPDEVTMKATVRSHDEETRLALKEKLERTVLGIAASAGAPEPEYEFYFGTPGGYNDPELVAQVRAVVRRVLGEENDLEYPPAMGGEDFSRYGRVVPGFQFRLGVAPDGAEMTLHRPDFSPDERAVGIGMLVVSEILWDQLQR